MLDQNPLNPELYNALQRRFSKVEISNAGIPRTVSYLPDWHHGGRKKAVEIQSGEYYQINCPYCKESRQRLYLNHQWGEIDLQTGRRNLHLAYCFNNHDCLTSEANQQHLYHWLYPIGRSRVESRKGQQPPIAAALPVPREFTLPENLIPIHELSTDHPAAQYWLNRGFNLEELGHWWRVSYCEVCLTTKPEIYQRVVIPIYERQVSILDNQAAERLAGWQARIVQESMTGMPKYLFCQGIQKSRLLYNLPLALQIPGPVFVCEGVADVWKVGPAAVALFGKTLSTTQKSLLMQNFPGRPIVVVLDRDAQNEAMNILGALRSARSAASGDNRVVLAELPPGRKDPGDCTREEIFEAAQKALKQPGKEERTRIYHNALSAQHVEMQHDLPVPVHFEDLSVAAHLLDENAHYDLQNLIKRFLPDNSPAITSNPANPQLTQALDETLLIRRLWDQGQIAEQLEKQGLEFLYREIELPALAPLSAMMQHGVLFDVPKLAAHRDQYSPLIDDLIEHSSITGRIHSRLDPLRSRTGRIQSSKPSLQGIPVALRDAVVAEDKHVLLAADLSQFELRVMAHFAQEPEFLEVYRHGSGDLHLYTASRLFNIPAEKLTEVQRKIGKTVNFSLINGQTAKGLADELGIEIPEAVLFLDDFRNRYQRVAMWIDHSIQIARKQGYVTSLYGRRRHLPDLNADNPPKAFRAERQVVSGIIQATGADVFKWMLGRLYEKLPPEFKMVLPIHDAILFEIPENRMEEAKQLIREIMQESPPKFTIPLVANIHVGKSWKECQG